MTATRRQFLQFALTTGTGLALGASPVAAIEPIPRTGKPHLRLSLAAYGYRKYLDLKKPAAQPMTLDDFIQTAADMDLDAVELTAYYFRQTTPEYLAHLKGKCTVLGLDISGTAVGNNFCLPDAAKHKEQIASVKQWIEHSSRLGAKTLRIFAGTKDKSETEEQARDRCVAAIQECCDHAAKYGVFLALENHGGITLTIEQMMTLIKAIKHDWFGINVDTGNFRGQHIYEDIAKLLPYAVNVQLKTEIQPDKTKEEADLKRLIDILRAANYRGYVALEYEAEEDPKTAVPRHVATLRKLMR
jgi:sugar phosphate isomerase/epimerase